MPLRDPPVPTFASFFLGQISLTIDKPIVEGVFDPTNWTGRLVNRAFTVSSAGTTSSTNINLVIVLGAVDLGDNVLSYAASPADVRSTPGLVTMDAFTDFPIA